MTYLDSGFDVNIQREILPSTNNLSSNDIDSMFEGIDASKIFATGAIQSSDGRLSFNLEENTYIVSDGLTERVRLGRMEDGEYGIRIKDSSGNVLTNVTGTTNLMQSANGKMQLDFVAEQARWYDEQNLRVQIGRY